MVCPVCESTKAYYQLVSELESTADTVVAISMGKISSADDFTQTFDEIEIYMTDIHEMAKTGKFIIEPKRTNTPTYTWAISLSREHNWCKYR